MDIGILARDLATLLSPVLPYLYGLGAIAGRKAAEEAGKKFTEETWKGITSLWGKIKPGLDENLEGGEAIQSIASTSGDDESVEKLSRQIQLILKEHPEFIPEAGALVRTINISNSRQETFNIQASDRSIVIGTVTGNVSIESREQRPSPEAGKQAKDILGLSAADISSFSARSNEILRQTLVEDAENEFYRKYISQVYTGRDDTEEKFQRFIRQDKYRCYVVTGKAGKGKTSLLCHLATSLMDMQGSHIPILINSPELNLEQETLVGVLLRQLNINAPGDTETFEALARLLIEQQTLLVVFFDAINELHGQRAFETFNRQFDELLKLINRHNYPVLFGVSCRSEFWPQFSADSWWTHHAIFSPIGVDQPTHLLDRFSRDEIEQVLDKYFYWFRINGRLKEDALEDCRDPIMLRILCEAYTERSPKDKTTPPEDIPVYPLGDIYTLRRKEAFDRFVQAKREDIVRAVRSARELTDRNRTTAVTADEIYQLTTHYLISMADEMYRRGRAYITVDEAFQVARRLEHPDAQLGRELFLSDPRSIFFRLIDEGVILARRSTSTCAFVFETYFEYSLGRYIALVRWPGLGEAGLDAGLIEKDLLELIDQHKVLSQERSFTNLFGALQFAILVAEAGTIGTEKVGETTLSEEQRIYSDHPTLFIQLIRKMSEASAQGFDWIQQACATMRETELVQPARWEEWGRHPEQLPRVTMKFHRLIGVLDELTKLSDFVVLWDIENTLLVLAKANFDLTIEHIRNWVEGGTGLQPMFGTQALTRLCAYKPRVVMELLLDIIDAFRDREDFWLNRIIIHSVVELSRNQHEIVSRDKSWRQLRNMVQEFAFHSSDPYTRGVALAALPMLSDNFQTTLDGILARVTEETWTWAFWNLAYELRYWPAYWPDEEGDWIWTILHKLGDIDDPHIRYAVDRAAHELSARNPKAAQAVQKKMRGNLWRASLSYGNFDSAAADQIGIVYAPAFFEPAYDNHIECRERIQAIIDKLEKSGFDEAGRQLFNWITPRPAEKTQLEWAHRGNIDRHRDGSPWPDYVETVRKEGLRLEKESGLRRQSGPSELRYESYDVALLSVGSVLTGIDYVFRNGRSRSAFAINRPPGHLANNTICLFNNIAIGAHYARENYDVDRILIVDCDAHHGKHTNQVFLEDPDIIYFSMHIDGDYAREAGMVQHTGLGEGEGYNFNLPYPSGMPDEGYQYMIDQLLIPLAKEFKPGLILLSAGFDGHFDDPLTPNCILTDRAYMYLAERLFATATELDARIVGALEGGYGLTGMANSIVQMIAVFGQWPEPARREIGFTPLPADYEQRCNPRALSMVELLVRNRVREMEKVKHRNPDYRFDLSNPHWQGLLGD